MSPTRLGSVVRPDSRPHRPETLGATPIGLNQENRQPKASFIIFPEKGIDFLGQFFVHLRHLC
jgi:hypothetical protein